jgi:hypothetical protein
MTASVAASLAIDAILGKRALIAAFRPRSRFILATRRRALLTIGNKRRSIVLEVSKVHPACQTLGLTSRAGLQATTDWHESLAEDEHARATLGCQSTALTLLWVPCPRVSVGM